MSRSKVKGQGRQGQKRHFRALSAVCMLFMFGKTSSSSFMFFYIRRFVDDFSMSFSQFLRSTLDVMSDTVLGYIALFATGETKLRFLKWKQNIDISDKKKLKLRLSFDALIVSSCVEIT